MRLKGRKLQAADGIFGKLGFPAMLCVLFASAAWGADLVQVQTFRTHSRFAVAIDEGIAVDWRKDGAGFRLLLKGASLADLGAPLGEEKEWAKAFVALKDPRVAGLDISEVSDGVQIVGRWRYPTGGEAPADPQMETFDYRNKAPAQFIVDVWHHAGPTVAQVNAQKKAAQAAAQVKHAQAEKAARVQRKLASIAAQKEADDVGRFCRDPLSEKNDVILQMRPLREPLDFSRWVKITSPDANYEYYQPEGKDSEAQYVRLALELYRQGKFALVNRTLDFFHAEHPKTSYDAEMRFLRANSLIKLGFEKEGQDMLAAIVAEQREAPVALHAALYQAVTRSNAGQHLAALESFMWLAKNYPDHRLNWLFHFAAAEAYALIREAGRAAKEYQWVVEYAPEPMIRADAATRIGDLYLDRLQYEQALAAYSSASTYFKSEAPRFPNYLLNRAETLYHLGQFDRAKGEYQEFLKQYAAYPSAWRATYRLGEIAARKGDPQARAHYYATVNHYPFSPGATLARLRLIPCGDQAGMTLVSGQKFLDEDAARFNSRDILLERYPDYRALATIRALWSWTAGSRAKGAAGAAARAKDDLPIEAIVRELMGGKSPEMREILAPMLATLFRQRVERLLAAGKKAEAVAFYQKRAAYVLGESGGLRPGESEYLLRLSQAASSLGLGQMAEQIARSYQKASAGRAPAATPGSAPERALRLSEQQFTQAKALWIAEASAPKPETAEKIRTLLGTVSDESPFSYEKEIILGRLAERTDQPEAALKHAVRAQLLRPQDSAGGAADLGRLACWVATLQVRAGDPKEALPVFRGVENQIRGRQPAAETPVPPRAVASELDTLGIPVVPELATLILTQAGILEKLGRWGEAASTYGRAIEAGLGGNQATFGQARAQLRTGAATARTQGLATLEKLVANTDSAPGSANDPWVRLAKEALATEKAKMTNRKGAKEGATP